MPILLLAAVLPVFFLAYFFYQKDTEKEPTKLLFKSFLVGMLIVIPVVFFEMYVQSVLGVTDDATATWDHFLMAFGVAAFVEETFKLLGTKWILRRNKYFDQFYDGIVYAVFVSLGFALVENIGYVIQFGLQTAIVRALLSVPLHAFCGVFMGYFLSKAYLGPQRDQLKNRLLAWIVPIGIHGAFDFILFNMSSSMGQTNIGIFIYLILLLALNITFWKQGLKRINRYIKQDKANLNTPDDPQIF